MILLYANKELHQTFEKLIQAAKLPVQWNGVFAVIDNYMILQGEVRSLFFNFDNKKVATNIIDVPKQDKIMETVGDNMRLQNAINMILYAFGKWGTLTGIRVEKDYAQLNGLFSDIMEEYDIEPEYTPQYMRFYRGGMRVTYEDVIQMAMEYEDGEEEEDEARGQGLWRKIIWKRAKAEFARVDISEKERNSTRLGSNFYMVGYLCPSCGKNVHMVVYPEGKEVRIETEEGGVLLARAATCEHCRCFYTPRPKKLFAEGDIYVMEFEDDVGAYEDYLELIGREGDRVSNYHCNEYADGRQVEGEDEAEDLEELYAYLPELSEEELQKIQARMEEGFYSEESLAKFGPAIKEQVERRAKKEYCVSEEEGANQEADRDEAYDRNVAYGTNMVRSTEKARGTEKARDTEMACGTEKVRGIEKMCGTEKVYGTEGNNQDNASDHRTYGVKKDDIIVSPAERDEVRNKFEARMEMLERYSERQLRELKGQLERERKLPADEKASYIKRVESKLYDEQVERLTKKTKSCEGKNYIVIKRMIEEVESAQIPQERKLPLFDMLHRFKKEQADLEVRQLVAKMPKDLDRGQYIQYVKRIRDYEEVDFSPYEEELKERRMASEKQEVTNLVKRARKVCREDYVELRDRLRDGDFLPELVLPYIEKVEERIKEMDAEAIALICPNPMQMTFEEGMQAYEQIEQGDFLPELKTDALKMLRKRLSKIKTDECELLVHKLKDELAQVGIVNQPKHHFYPAKRALLKQTSPEELDVIEYALASYAAGRGEFEYPILVVDVTRSGTGREGIILTPEHLYYSTLLNAYGVKIDTIARIEASTGLLNRGIYLYQRNGTKIKLPYAVENSQLESYAKVLDEFVKYLQEKPDSRSLGYLVNETHETICCFRCGHEYKGGDVCPKCGYQNNA